jgi:group I intron endonuclease
VPKNTIGTIKNKKMKRPNNAIVGIYKITNPKGKVYIGQSVDIERRFLKYQYVNTQSKQPRIYNSIKKYGWKNHIFEIIEECPIGLLDERELYWGENFKVLEEDGLNCRLGNGKGNLRKETKEKIGNANIGKKRTQEQKNKISLSKIGGKGYPKGIKRPIEFGENLSKLLKGKSKNTKGIPKPKGFNSHLSKSIQQFTLDNILIREWDSLNHASKTLNIDITGISKCANGKFKSSYGFIWKFKKLNDE